MLDASASNDPQDQFADQVVASIERASADYPDAAVAGTELHSNLAAELERHRSENSPLLNCPTWPELLTALVASRLGMLPKSVPLRMAWLQG